MREAPQATPGLGNAPDSLSPTRYLAWLYSPPSEQRVLATLCAIESEVAGSLRAGVDHTVAHARLQWWREECERSARGQPVHPLTRDLVQTFAAEAAAAPSPIAGISGFVDTAVWDLAGATFETRKELTAYCERWAAAMFEPVAARIAHVAQGLRVAHEARPLDQAVAAAGSRWRTLGTALREIELLTDLARESHAGRVRVPLDELQRAGVQVSSLAKPPWPAALASVLRERHETLRATIASAVAGITLEEQSRFRGLLVWTALVWRLSVRAQRALPNSIPPRRYHALADGWHAWRVARRAVAGKYRLTGFRSTGMKPP